MAGKTVAASICAKSPAIRIPPWRPWARTCGPAVFAAGDDLATVSRALKIRKDHLEALEEDRLEALPGRTYAVGFVRTYADYLGLDTARVIERYKAQIAGRTDDQTPTITIIDEDEHRRLPQGWKIVAGVVFLLLAYGAYHLIVPAADKMLAPPVASGTGAAGVEVCVEHAAQNPYSPPRRGRTAAGNAKCTSPRSRAGCGRATAASKPQFRRAKVYGKQHQDARVVLRMRQATHVLVRDANGTVFVNRTLNAGDSYMVPNLTGLTLTTEDAGAVEIDLDGVAMGAAGQSGQIGEALSLDPQAIADRNSKRPG